MHHALRARIPGTHALRCQPDSGKEPPPLHDWVTKALGAADGTRTRIPGLGSQETHRLSDGRTPPNPTMRGEGGKERKQETHPGSFRSEGNHNNEGATPPFGNSSSQGKLNPFPKGESRSPYFSLVNPPCNRSQGILMRHRSLRPGRNRITPPIMPITPTTSRAISSHPPVNGIALVQERSTSTPAST